MEVGDASLMVDLVDFHILDIFHYSCDLNYDDDKDLGKKKGGELETEFLLVFIFRQQFFIFTLLTIRK
jgi:hypothetical protein